MRDIGVQIERTTFGGSRSRIFIDLGRIKDVLINEAFHGHDVITYIVIMVEAERKLTLPYEVRVHALQ